MAVLREGDSLLRMSDFTEVSGSQLGSLQLVGYMSGVGGHASRVSVPVLLGYIESLGLGGGTGGCISAGGPEVITVTALAPGVISLRSGCCWVFSGVLSGGSSKVLEFNLEGGGFVNGGSCVLFVYGAHTISFGALGCGGSIYYQDGYHDLGSVGAGWVCYTLYHVGLNYFINRGLYVKG